jgi:hypothetical protein
MAADSVIDQWLAIAFWFGLVAPPVTFLRGRTFLNGRFSGLFRAIFKNLIKKFVLQKKRRGAPFLCVPAFSKFLFYGSPR